MRRVDFDIAGEAVRGADVNLDGAEEVIRRNRHLLGMLGVVGIWAGARASEPYIMLAIQEGRMSDLSKTIPDSIDGVKVYYVEGILN